MDFCIWIPNRVFRQQGTKSWSKSLAEVVQIQRKWSKAVRSIEHAVTCHGRLIDHCNQALVLEFRQIVASSKLTWVGPDLTAEIGCGHEICQCLLELN